ncbi:hypothetical protein Tco_0496702 [Tanacetum coccineum]
MESGSWPQIDAGIQQHLQKIYNGKKAALKKRHWVPNDDGTYDVERIRRGRPSHIFEVDWDAQIAFWNDPKNLARAAQNKQNWAKSKVDEMLSLQGLGSNSSTGVPYTEDEIMAIIRGGNQRGHIPGGLGDLPDEGRTVILPSPLCTHSSDVAKLKKSEKWLTKQVNMFMKLFRSNDKLSQLLTQLQSQHEVGSGSESGEGGDDESGEDEDVGEEEEDEDMKELRPSTHGLLNNTTESPGMSTFFGDRASQPSPEAANNYTNPTWSRSQHVDGGDHVRKVFIVFSLVLNNVCS